ncbi:kynureninase [Wallemia mellicola CBS 633.66]|uniref:Kynureninase n=2 Tax=Wallemia mellicola TaxID=1708541 RepID=I4YBS3_WALMC|nr:kynureninase [Wallemia mellicola CBS 633.66]EIM21415.1 kynureninase [Wallemia mellicola CBS 633.66]TIB97235.1 kynureninase [Wallemia mellicola]TIC10747.1 kynureninase [Wallemia mellicola]TIC29499.1 kynureninase [Wallemia mellicola]|eukprot:XP_006958446.1 kynureninase [Wallemia mellicola CBS 633.66]
MSVTIDYFKGIEDIKDEKHYKLLDDLDSLSNFKNEFHTPAKDDGQIIYLCGNSLGLMPKRTQNLLIEELDVWKSHAVQGHFDHPHNRPWKSCDELVKPSLGRLVGAKPDEVVAMGQLTSNLHKLLISFYKPTEKRYKIVYEDNAFPSDNYALQSHARLHNINPDDALVRVKPRAGESTLRTQDILQTLDEHDDSIALVMFSGVQFYTGQFFDIGHITSHAKSKGAVVGWDLAHAVGNVPLKLHEWGVDFAVWCSYKYLNSSPGGIAGIFIHELLTQTHIQVDHKRMEGWWGHDPETRFEMGPHFTPSTGASAWMVSNTPVLTLTALYASLQIFDEAGIDNLRAKSIMLTGYMERLLKSSNHYTDNDQLDHKQFTIITPSNVDERGAQLSLKFNKDYMLFYNEQLQLNGVIGDDRKPEVIRLAPIPLYNSFKEVYDAVSILERIMDEF